MTLSTRRDPQHHRETNMDCSIELPKGLHLYTETGLDVVYDRMSKGQSNHGFRERAGTIHWNETRMVKRKASWVPLAGTLLVLAFPRSRRLTTTNYYLWLHDKKRPPNECTLFEQQ